MIKSIIPIVKFTPTDRSCDGCTRCCEGYTIGEVFEHPFYPGKPCHFMGKTGCTVYEHRPYNPCQEFKCAWLSDSVFPVWMKPDVINAIIVKRKTPNGIDYITVKEAGEKLKVEVLSWLFMSVQNKAISNVRYEINGGWNFIGTSEFIKAMNNMPVENAPVANPPTLPRRQI